MTQQRLILLRTLDMQVRRVQELEGNLSAEKAPDWLLKEFLYLVSLAQPETKLIKDIQELFKVNDQVKESLLAQTRAKMSGPDQTALDSLSQALQEEIQRSEEHTSELQSRPH